MTDLTSQWKKGELPSGWYYTKLWKGCNVIDYFIGNQFLRYDDSDIDEILAPVPSYEEWQEKLKENAQLKKLLKECVKMNTRLENALWQWNEESELYDENEALENKINEVLK